MDVAFEDISSLSHFSFGSGTCERVSFHRRSKTRHVAAVSDDFGVALLSHIWTHDCSAFRECECECEERSGRVLLFDSVSLFVSHFLALDFLVS